MLILATEQEKLDRDRLTHESWGKGLTAEGYLERESRLREHPWSRDGMASWVFKDDRGAILASCETFRMESFLPGASEAGRSYGIASVFTEHHLRGRGHASRMMSLVHEQVLERDPEAHACILFSDVGPALYNRSGYVERPAQDRVFEPAEGDPGEGVALVGEADVPEALASIPRPQAGFTIWPTAGQIDWHIERERAYSSVLGRPRPPACGARAGRSTILWAGGFKTNELCILLLHAESPDELHVLLRAARRAARAAGLDRVSCWDYPMPLPWPAGPEGGALEARDGAIPMLRPMDPRVSPDTWTVVPRALWV